MSGIIGCITGKTGSTDYTWDRDRPEHLIHSGTFTFSYGGANTTCNYTLPETADKQWYRLRFNMSDTRWSSEAVLMSSSGYYGACHNLYNHWNTVVVSTAGVVSCTNGNGGVGGPYTAELRVWEIESDIVTSWNYAGG
jgi:hypothetical protein